MADNKGREIKFRAWLLLDRKMVSVARITLESLRGPSIEHSFSSGVSDELMSTGNVYERTRRATNFVLMQYTGLHDKNGREIYEGDIVKITHPKIRGMNQEEPEVGPIVFDEQFAKFGFMSASIVYGLVTNDHANEVIGNIYENSELLKVPS